MMPPAIILALAEQQSKICIFPKKGLSCAQFLSSRLISKFVNPPAIFPIKWRVTKARSNEFIASDITGTPIGEPDYTAGRLFACGLRARGRPWFKILNQAVAGRTG